MTGWATLARERAGRLEHEIIDLRKSAADTAELDQLRAELTAVRQRHINAPHRLDWLTGTAINESWSELHRIEERIDELKPEAYTDQLVRTARVHAEGELTGRRAAALKSKLDEPLLAADRRKAALTVIHEAHYAAEERHESERNQQRGILYFAAGFLVAAVVMIAVQAMVPAGDRIIPLPGSGAMMPGWALLALVMLFGMLGGALSALVALYMTGRKLTSTLWFDSRPVLSLVKVTMGLWTAVLGVLAVGTGVIVGVYTSLASVFLLAFVFGYAQQVVTRFIDRRAADMAGAGKS